MKKVILLVLMLALFGCEEGSGGGSSSVNPSYPGDVKSHEDVVITENRDAGAVIGGDARTDTGNATATGSVSGEGKEVGGTVIGAYSEVANKGNANSEGKVTLTDSSVEGRIYGGYARTVDGNATANNSIVEVTAGTFSKEVVGGLAVVEGQGSAAASGNSVKVTGAEITGDILGGWSIIEGEGKTAEADRNEVTIERTSVGGDIYGGVVRVEKDATVQSVSASFNNVTINEGTRLIQAEAGDKGDYLMGGYIELYGNVTGSLKAVSNTVNLNGGLDLSGGQLYGGYASRDISKADTFTGNALKVNEYAGAGKLAEIGGFQFFDFIINTSVQNGDKILQTEKLFLGSVDKPSEVRTLQFSGASAPGLKKDDSIYLIYSDNKPEGELKTGKVSVTGQWGSLFTQEGIFVNKVDNGITATVGQPDVHYQPSFSNSTAARDVPEDGSIIIVRTIPPPPEREKDTTPFNVSSMIYQPETVYKPAAVDTSTFPAAPLESFERKVKYNPDGAMYGRHGKRFHSGGGTRILTDAQKQRIEERREARREAWANMTDEQKKARREARQARMDAGEGHRFHKGKRGKTE